MTFLRLYRNFSSCIERSHVDTLGSAGRPRWPRQALAVSRRTCGSRGRCKRLYRICKYFDSHFETLDKKTYILTIFWNFSEIKFILSISWKYNFNLIGIFIFNFLKIKISNKFESMQRMQHDGFFAKRRKFLIKIIPI